MKLAWQNVVFAVCKLQTPLPPNAQNRYISLGITRPSREQSQAKGERGDLRGYAHVLDNHENKESKKGNLANSRREEWMERLRTRHG